MANYHPDSRYLNDYAAGNLSVGMAIMVKTHLEFCSECRNHVHQLEQLGGTLFNEQPAEQAVSSSLFEKLMSRIDTLEPSAFVDEEPSAVVDKEPSAAERTQDVSAAHGNKKPASYKKVNGDLPVVVDKLVNEKLDKLSWQKLGKSLNFSRLVTGDKDVELGFYNIKAGGKIPDHKHHCDEVTVVLKGSFSDLDGVYKKGDFIVRTNGEHHSPIATQDEDCLCLSALEKPIAFTGLYRLLNPFLKVHPA